MLITKNFSDNFSLFFLAEFVWESLNFVFELKNGVISVITEELNLACQLYHCQWDSCRHLAVILLHFELTLYFKKILNPVVLLKHRLKSFSLKFFCFRIWSVIFMLSSLLIMVYFVNFYDEKRKWCSCKKRNVITGTLMVFLAAGLPI